jgi:putative ABC transport system ATP-binding protein
MNMLELKNIYKTYNGPAGPVKVLNDLSLNVKPGEFLAIKGPSGCGKSTLLMTCGTLLSPDSGNISIYDQEPYLMDKEKCSRFRAETIGFVFQRFHLTPYLNVLENIMAPTLALNVANAKNRAMELLERFELEHRRKHRPAELSVGERQRIGLARALFHSPRLLLADEPTGNLDANSAEIVLKAFDEFTHNGGITIIVTHDQNAAERADKILKMEKGKLI